MTLGAIGAAAVVGFADDWIKVTRERNLGLTKTAKTVGLLVVAVVFAAAAARLSPVHTTLGFTRFDAPGIELGSVGWAALTVALIFATSNAVNLTDGLDGLAAGAGAMGFAAYTVIGFWALTHPAYQLTHAFDLAVVSAAMLGACIGFLWWNAAPARVFMGDTGSLAVGTALACLAALTATPLLLPIVAGLFVFEALSVVVQVAGFRLMGKRPFRMAPAHHHFELAGWPESTVIIRLWILAGMCTAFALAIFYADFTGTPPLSVGSTGG